VTQARTAGIASDRLVLDPGFGFGKTLQHNLELLRRYRRVTRLQDCPCWRDLTQVDARRHHRAAGRRPLGRQHRRRLAGVQRGARILRVHDVAQTRDALAIWQAVEGQ
jgi:dihydropteroate synthase